MSDTIHSKVLILGSGPAGYTAAIYASRAMLEPVLLTGIEPGGQMTITTDVENYPGYSDVIQGPWLMEQMREQAEKVGTKIILDTIIDVDLSKRPFILTSDSEKKYSCDSLIISTGAQAKWLGLESENKFKGYGVSACATCDGFFYKEKKVVVVGGGNTAVEEALFLTNFATKVTLIHRRDTLRAEKILQDRIFKNPKIEVLWNKNVKEFRGSKEPLGLEQLLLEDSIDKSESTLKVTGAFIAIGHDPSTSLFINKVDMDNENYIITKPDSTETSISGVFAAGDVKDKIYRQAVTAA